MKPKPHFRWYLALFTALLVGTGCANCEISDLTPETDAGPEEAVVSTMANAALGQELIEVGTDWDTEFSQQGASLVLSDGAAWVSAANPATGHLFLAEQGSSELWIVDRNGINPAGGYCVDENNNACNSDGSCNPGRCNNASNFVSPGLKTYTDGSVIQSLAVADGDSPALYVLLQNDDQSRLAVFDLHMGISDIYEPDSDRTYHEHGETRPLPEEDSR